MNPTRTLIQALALCLAHTASASDAAEPPAHFDPQGKPPSTFTLELRNGPGRSLALPANGLIVTD